MTGSCSRIQIRSDYIRQGIVRTCQYVDSCSIGLGRVAVRYGIVIGIGIEENRSAASIRANRRCIDYRAVGRAVKADFICEIGYRAIFDCCVQFIRIHSIARCRIIAGYGKARAINRHILRRDIEAGRTIALQVRCQSRD
jgi:hypothetical protein